jgi:hypothetical protein
MRVALSGASRALESAELKTRSDEVNAEHEKPDDDAAEDELEDQRIADLPGTVPFVVTEAVGGVGAAAAPPPPTTPIVARELRNILSFQPSTADLDGTQRALDRAFDRIEEDGITKVVYAPRGPSIAVEGVEITGAQGAIYQRARSALDEMVVALDELEPMLDEIADEEAVEAVREIVRSELRQIVTELGAEGGPNVLLIDGLWAQLLGVEIGEVAAPQPNKLEGNLGELRERFYLKRRYIDTIDDEANYTRFLTLAEQASSLQQSWTVHRDAFIGGRKTEYFGQVLVHLRRVLQTISDDVDEAERALDGVNIGRSERQLQRVEYAGAPLYLQATLDWIRRFVTEDALHLIDVAGKDGAIALYPTLWSMAEAAEEFVPPVPGFPTLYNSPLVRASTGTLASALDDAVRIVDRVGPPPAVLRVLPRRAPRPGAAQPPEEALEPSIQLREVLPARKQRVGVRIAIVDPFGRVIDAARRHQFDREELALFLRDPGGNELRGNFVVEDEENGDAIFTYEFNLGRATVEAPLERLELLTEFRGTRSEPRIGFRILP